MKRILSSKLLEGPQALSRDRDRKVMEVAKLLRDNPFIQQRDIAREVKVSEASVTRLRREVFHRKILSHTLVPIRNLELEEELLGLGEHLGLKDLFIVPGGRGKNETNLGAIGGSVLLAAIDELARRSPHAHSLRLTLSCGRTLQALVRSFLSLLETSEVDRRDLSLEFLPATLYPSHDVAPIYPSTLVTTLAIMAPQGENAPRVSARVASLPRNFYSLRPSGRDEYLSQYGPNDLLKEAAAADIFVVGVGTTVDESYRHLMREVHEASQLDAAHYPAEIGFIPIDAGGSGHTRIQSKLVGIGLDKLRRAAESENRLVIGLIGGEQKAHLLASVMRSRCFSVIIADEDAAIAARSELRTRKTRPRAGLK